MGGCVLGTLKLKRLISEAENMLQSLEGFQFAAMFFILRIVLNVDETKRDELVHDLIKEDLIDGVTHAEMFNKGHAILNMLISSGLLEAVESSLEANQIQCVKMHDVIRDTALQILAGDDNVMRSISTQHSRGMYLQVMLEWVFVLTNLILETLSTFFLSNFVLKETSVCAHRYGDVVCGLSDLHP